MTGPFVVCLQFNSHARWHAVKERNTNEPRRFATVADAETWVERRDEELWTKVVAHFTIMPLAQYIIEQGL